MRKTLVGILAVITVVIIVRCTSPGGTKAVPGSTLTLIYQQGREGQLEPCGCHTTPYGGIDREFNALTALRKADSELLFVDGGNLFVPVDEKAPMGHYRERGATLVGMLNEMQMDAFGVGPLDYKMGLEHLKTLEGQAKFKFVATNVEDAKGDPIFARYQIVEKNSIPVAFLSVIPQKANPGPGLKVTPPKAAIEKALAEIGDKAKVVIVATQTGSREADRKLAASLPQVSVWIGNDTKYTIHDGDPQKTALLLDGHQFGYYLGKAQLQFKFPITGFYSDKMLKDSKATLEGYEKATARMTDPKQKAAAEAKIADFKKTAVLEAPATASVFSNELIALDEATYGKPNAFTERLLADKQRIKAQALDGVGSAKKK